MWYDGKIKGLGLPAMGWTKGQSGNPLGRRSEKEFAAQLRIVLAELVDENDPQSVRKMRRIAEKLVDWAMSGEPWAIAQVADRLDGKPAQMIEAPTGGGEMVRRKLTYEIVHVTKTPEELNPIENADYHEVKAINGNGHDHADSEVKTVDGNGHRQRD